MIQNQAIKLFIVFILSMVLAGCITRTVYIKQPIIIPDELLSPVNVPQPPIRGLDSKR